MRIAPASNKATRLTSLAKAVTVAGLVLAAPAAVSEQAFSQSPQPQTQPPQQGQQGGPDVNVRQPAPEITVKQPPPQVTVQPTQPNVKVEQQGQPKVEVQRPGQGEQAGQAGEQQQGGLAQMGRGIVGKDVYSSTDESIGEVEDVVMGANNQIQSALIDVGGFLGIGERRVAVPVTNLRLEGDRLISTMTRQQIEQLPEHDTNR